MNSVWFIRCKMFFGLYLPNRLIQNYVTAVFFKENVMYLISLILGIRTWFSDSRDLKFSGKMHLHKNIHVKIRWQKLCLTPSLSVVFGEIPYSVLSNSTTHQQIVLESCSNPIHSATLHWKKNWGSGFHFFAGDFVSGVGFWTFWLPKVTCP